eukprot:COSAG01_NODE_352_length_18424_cov_29.195034_19_plen_76_part_00
MFCLRAIGVLFVLCVEQLCLHEMHYGRTCGVNIPGSQSNRPDSRVGLQLQMVVGNMDFAFAHMEHNVMLWHVILW